MARFEIIHPADEETHRATGFVEAVVRAEEQNPEDDAEALRAIQAALKAVLVAKGAI